ncbi:unnamed protein product [Sphenostylis stenocarpa]|uniref:Uncharacterized protein n=1 Tax=Sphenostylis stenocarpa TaxID=92480 RepID=A0AA86SEH2_9FABA|nr:unnamed protein product [Sphenostylis stenocarpa]
MALHRLSKRKGCADQLNDDFPLSSPATKIRRLDAELPPIVEEEEPLPSPNEERALVLFKPLAHSSFSFTVDSDIIDGIKNNQSLWSKQCDGVVSGLQSLEKGSDELALVPWVPSPSYQFSVVDGSDNTNTELMEADDDMEEEGVGSMMMDIEQEGTYNDPTTDTSNIHYPTTHNVVTEGFQQHCLFPQLPHNTSTPITWSR